MNIESFFDKDTSTVTYIVSDPATRRCAVIDPVMNYNPDAGKTSTMAADRVIDFVKQKGFTVEWLLETHIHADHLTATSYLKEKLGGKTGIGSRITEVLEHWVPLFDTAHDTPMDGSQFDHLFEDGETFTVDNLDVKTIHTPGHTPACVCYLIGDAIFVGDTLFMPYVGTARTDFPGGDAASMYRSIQKIFALPDATRLFTCHDYPPEGQSPAWESTVGEQKSKNILINANVSQAEYIKTRNKRDHGKAVPRLLLPSIQINLRAGNLGEMESNGISYVKIPLNKI